PLILPTVDYQAVASVVADWTGIPVGRMARNEIDAAAEAVDAGGAPLGEGEARLDEEQRQALHARLAELQAQLSALQGEEPLILPTVDYQAVASVVADWTGIPVGRMARNEID
ncbi:hypothetical protein ACXKGW_29785, partial [Klebsiella pneumoniae subsp. pneumoniae]